MRSGPSTSRWGTLLTLPVWERGPLTAKARGYRSVAMLAISGSGTADRQVAGLAARRRRRFWQRRHGPILPVDNQVLELNSPVFEPHAQPCTSGECAGTPAQTPDIAPSGVPEPQVSRRHNPVAPGSGWWRL